MLPHHKAMYFLLTKKNVDHFFVCCLTLNVIHIKLNIFFNTFLKPIRLRNTEEKSFIIAHFT